ncbi:hypothetical protein [Streptomyces sp. NPDC058307]|uniref:hypothetical protein n=1 Tax=Streptomyces sp. NPDC058307 TaxID=3346439 RepID=UPI0036EDBE94
MPYKGSSAREEARGTYSGSARFGRIGERTRRQDGTHVGLALTVHNPSASSWGQPCRRKTPSPGAGR